MKHIKSVSNPLPAKAESLIETGQKIAVFTAFSESLVAFADGVLAIFGIGDAIGGDDEEA